MNEHEPFETLDPEDWEAMRELGHRVVDDVLNYFQTTRERPAWQPVPADVAERLDGAGAFEAG